MYWKGSKQLGAFPAIWAELLTHGLVSRGYRGRVVQDQDLGLKLPGGQWAQLW